MQTTKKTAHYFRTLFWTASFGLSFYQGRAFLIFRYHDTMRSLTLFGCGRAEDYFAQSPPYLFSWSINLSGNSSYPCTWASLNRAECIAFLVTLLLPTPCISSWKGPYLSPSHFCAHCRYFATAALPFPLQNPYAKCVSAHSSCGNVKGISLSLFHQVKQQHQSNKQLKLRINALWWR